jgi:hypothetical protein
LIHFDWDGFIVERTPSVAECSNNPLRIGGTYEFITRIAPELAHACRRPSGLTAFLIDIEFALADVRRNKTFGCRVTSFSDAKARKNNAE